MNSVIYKPVLVLDKSFQPYGATRVYNAFKGVMKDRAKFVDENYNVYDIHSWLQLPVTDRHTAIKTPRHCIRKPELMRFTNYQKNHKRAEVMFNRKNLYKRDCFRCQYCSKRPRHDEISIDHVVPQSRGGPSSFENCVLCCLACNLKKDNKTPEEAGMQLRKLVRGPDGLPIVKFYVRPVRPRWSPIYSLPKLREYPESWKNFLGEDEFYWEIELEN